jgi:hypothetical protein
VRAARRVREETHRKRTGGNAGTAPVGLPHRSRRASCRPAPLLPARAAPRARAGPRGPGPAGSGDRPGRADPGPARRGPRGAGPRADHHPDQPHLTAGAQDRPPLRHRRHRRRADPRRPPDPARGCSARTRPTCASAGTREYAVPSGCTPNCEIAATAAACAPCAGSPPSSARPPPSPRRHHRPRPGKQPAGS